MPCLTMTALILVLVSASASAARAARGAGPEPAQASVDLAGRWIYNVPLSDDAREKMREGMEGRGGPGGGRPPMGPGGGGGGGGGGMGGPGAEVGGWAARRAWPGRQARAVATIREKPCARSWSRPKSC